MKYANNLFSTAAALFAFAAPSLGLADLEIVSTEHRDADSFKRFSEYFTGDESSGRYTIFRSDPNRRDGFYVSLIASDREDFSNVAAVRIQFVRPGTQEIESHVSEPATLRKKRILVGLTEPTWSDPDSRPVAWKIDLLDSSGKSLDSAASFLWSE